MTGRWFKIYISGYKNISAWRFLSHLTATPRMTSGLKKQLQMVQEVAFIFQ